MEENTNTKTLEFNDIFSQSVSVILTHYFLVAGNLFKSLLIFYCFLFNGEKTNFLNQTYKGNNDMHENETTIIAVIVLWVNVPSLMKGKPISHHVPIAISMLAFYHNELNFKR